jgi:hypothetical protein
MMGKPYAKVIDSPGKTPPAGARPLRQAVHEGPHAVAGRSQPHHALQKLPARDRLQAVAGIEILRINRFTSALLRSAKRTRG